MLRALILYFVCVDYFLSDTIRHQRAVHTKCHRVGGEWANLTFIPNGLPYNGINSSAHAFAEKPLRLLAP